MKKIFLIEDENMIREMYEMVLRRRGYSVDSTDNGQEAVNILTKGNPEYDLILLDIMLPKMNGIDVLKEIKKEKSPAREIPVYLITNLGQESIINAAFELGAVDFIIKSKHLPDQVADKVGELLNEG